MSKNNLFIDTLETMLKANMTPWIITHEEERLIFSLRKLVPKFKGSDFRILVWSVSEGLYDYTSFLKPNEVGKFGKIKPVMADEVLKDSILGDSIKKDAKQVYDFDELIHFLKENGKNNIILIKDIHFLVNHRVASSNLNIRKIRDIISRFRTDNQWLMLLSLNDDIPSDLEKEIQILDMPLPDQEEIGILLKNALLSFEKAFGKDIKVNVTNDLADKIIFNLLGLTETEISQVLTYTCVNNTGINATCLNDIKDMKRQIIERKGYLEFIPTSTTIEVGGHNLFKEYVYERSLYLKKNFREEFSLQTPKGVCLVGVPGAGKSLFARYLGAEWQVPLIRLDMGALFGERLGESEESLRNALKIAEASAPCILWIDEIEKAIGGLNSSDSGTTQRVFGKLLTWMSERKEMVYIYSTANNIDIIPPEFKRAGRLDSIWWADLPDEIECEKIIEIQCKQKTVKLDLQDIKYLSKIAFELQLTGAEIEHAIIESCYKAASRSKLLKEKIDVNRQIVEESMKFIRPYAVTNSEGLKKNRIEALEKFEFTSSSSKTRAEKIKGDIAAHKSEFNEN